jgi:hypothetical protein
MIPAALVCCECECASRGAAIGWEGHLVDLDDDGADEIAFFCPECAEREFALNPRNEERGSR